MVHSRKPSNDEAGRFETRPDSPRVKCVPLYSHAVELESSMLRKECP